MPIGAHIEQPNIEHSLFTFVVLVTALHKFRFARPSNDALLVLIAFSPLHSNLCYYLKMEPNWSTLPDVCLLLIFKKLPLALLFGTLSMVCRNWSQVVEGILQTKTELVLMGDLTDLEEDIEKLHKEANPIGSELFADALRNVAESAWARELVSRSSIEFNLIRVPAARGVSTLTERIATSLRNRLASVTHLTVVLSWFQNQGAAGTSLGQLARIINHYRNRLVSLKLDLNYHSLVDLPGTAIQNRVRELFNSINRVAQLDHLTLNVHFERADLQPRDFAFLSRVRHFTTHQFLIGRRKPARLLLASLVEHATGGRCNEIDIDLKFESDDVKGLSPQLANKFRLMIVNQEMRNMERDMQQFGDRFVLLTSLELQLSIMSIAKLSRYLSRMTELVHLNLFYMYPGIYIEENHDAEPPEIIPLRSVRFLTLKVRLPTHSYFEKLHLGEVFPNVQVLRNRSPHYRCTECNTGSYTTVGLNKKEAKKTRKEDDAKAVKCTSQVQKSFFRLIPSLRVLQYDPDDPVCDRLKIGLPIGLFTDGGRSSPPAYNPAPRVVQDPGPDERDIPSKPSTQINYY